MPAQGSLVHGGAFTGEFLPPETAMSRSTRYFHFLWTTLVATMPIQTMHAATVAAGSGHSCGVMGDAIRCWGDNNYNQLGYWANGFELTATLVPGLEQGQSGAQLAARGEATCVVLDGGVKCWGHSDAVPNGPGPKVVEGLPAGAGVVAVAVGRDHACALIDEGVVCWGFNASSQLGRATSSSDDQVPAPVVGLEPGTGKGVTAIAAGYAHSCAAGSFGVRCWGYNDYGQLGDASQSVNESVTPVQVMGIQGGVERLTATDDGGCAVDSVGLKCWGSIDYPSLKSDEAVPIAGVPAGSFSALAGGGSHVCAIVNGSAYCFGRGTSGELGNGSPTSSTSAKLVGAGFIDVAAGEEHSCARTQAGELRCWGHKGRGQLGNGETVIEPRPLPVALPAGEVAVGISAGFAHTCARTSSGASYCWGLNDGGQLGTGTSGYAAIWPQPVVGLGGGTVDIDVSNNHSCAVASGQVYCWGFNGDGAIGQDPANQLSSSTPQVVSAIGQAVRVALGYQSSCVLTSGGGIYCFGAGAVTASLGDGNAWTPDQLPLALGTTASAIASGWRHVCAIVQAGLQCWGSNHNGQLGVDDPDAFAATPTGLAAGAGVTAVAAGDYHTCAILAGALECWGSNNDGALGRATTGNSNRTPAAVEGLGPGVSAVAAGDAFTCAVGTTGLYCWGHGSSGQLGTGDLPHQQRTPALVAGLGSAVTAVDAGEEHACAIAQGVAYCWGNNDRGRLGIFKSWFRSTPQPVLLRELFVSGFEN